MGLAVCGNTPDPYPITHLRCWLRICYGKWLFMRSGRILRIWWDIYNHRIIPKSFALFFNFLNYICGWLLPSPVLGFMYFPNGLHDARPPEAIYPFFIFIEKEWLPTFIWLLALSFCMYEFWDSFFFLIRYRLTPCSYMILFSSMIFISLFLSSRRSRCLSSMSWEFLS